MFFFDSQGLCAKPAGEIVGDYITGLDSVTGSDWVNLIEGFKNFDFEKIFDGSTNIASSFINNSTLSNSSSVVGAIKTIQENVRKGSKYIYDRNRRMIMSSATFNKQGGYYEIDPTILQAYPTRDFAYKNWQSNYRKAYGEETDIFSESIYKFLKGNPNVTKGTLSEYGYMVEKCQF